MVEVKDFLNPNSMLTPGMAGGLTTSITVPLALSFGLKVPWVTLSVSALFALLIVLAIKERLSDLHRLVYFVLNTLIIFSISLGTAFNLDRMPKPSEMDLQSQAKATMAQPLAQIVIDGLGIYNAHADDTSTEAIRRSRANTGKIMSVTPSEHSTTWSVDSKPALAPKHGSDDPDKRIQRDREYQEQLRQYRQRWSW